MSEAPEPKKKNWFARHKILTVLGAFVLIIIVASASSGGGKTADTVPKQEQAQATVVDFKAFGDEFDANQVAAEAKYKDKFVQLSAPISNITDTGLAFHNASSKEFSMTQVSCQMSDKNQLLALKNGQSVTVKGKVTGQMVGVINLADCSMVQ